MAAVPIKVPSVGESISEGILSRWLKPDGAAVKAGEPLYELETDKASNVVPADASGTLKIAVAEGETVPIGAVVGTIDPSAQPKAEPAAAPPAAEKPQAQTAPPTETRPAGSNGGSTPLSPAVRRLVTEEQVDAATVKGTGPGGRITKGDVVAHLAAAPEPATALVVRDPALSVSPLSTPLPPARPAETGPRESRKRMSGIRQKIAQRLVEAQQTAAILTTFNEADLSRIMDLRSRYKDSFKSKHGVGLGFMSFFVKAAIEALRTFPAVNARVEGSDIIYHNFYNIGVAVSTDRGLMVPVIRDADRLSFAEIEKAIASYATKAREGTIAVSDLQFGTFTITNGGVFGSLLSTPILNPPQSGILGMHAIQKRPVVVDDQVQIRPMMYLALSYDHRIVDGREAVSFLVRIKECVENPDRLMLDV
ncbi:MAG TPA: 2-oxoglutarate dehydrogenase complex dihydrolipoyllysine-residue succinyltransferase [Isosphaeraceae bacterium]|jgi:2-oxoglutarate dehydrogenase E2 component (dihydrolipoamide succinyltransferase)|nr:2-oxoglutarate dehydrogenase complex dihydrolipoyllysine-residue succinyltransferase [Isosphaeraceae bacterium]